MVVHPGDGILAAGGLVPVVSRTFPLAPLSEPDRRTAVSALSLDFVLDVIAIAPGEQNLLDTLLCSAVTLANIAPAFRDPEARLAYVLNEVLLDDARRRPVSVNALATSLGLPYETVRRRIAALVGRGVAVMVEGGVVIPAATLRQPGHGMAALRTYDRCRRLYGQMKAIDGLPALSRPARLPAGAAPVWTVTRLVGDYGLRFVELAMRELGELQDSLLFLGIIRQNVEHLGLAELRGDDGAPLPDRLRRPVSATALARRLGLPAETVRRHVAHLVEEGLCRSLGRAGFVVPAEVLALPAAQTVMDENVSNLHRLFTALGQLGVLRLWDEAG